MNEELKRIRTNHDEIIRRFQEIKEEERKAKFQSIAIAVSGLFGVAVAIVILKKMF